MQVVGDKVTSKLRDQPDPTIPTNIRIAFPVSCKAWTLATSTLAFSTMTASKSVFAALGASIPN